eukprot:COSAG02_NODE_13375_length_1402_cov_1.084421_1_plen_33_part_10
MNVIHWMSRMYGANEPTQTRERHRIQLTGIVNH